MRQTMASIHVAETPAQPQLISTKLSGSHSPLDPFFASDRHMSRSPSYRAERAIGIHGLAVATKMHPEMQMTGNTCRKLPVNCTIIQNLYRDASVK
jgi:hypothetical protein